MKNVLSLLIFISPFLYAQLSYGERVSDQVYSAGDFEITTDSLQKYSTPNWKTCVSPFVEVLGKGFLSLNVDFRRKESHSISIGIQPLEGLLPDVMYYHFLGSRRRLEIGGGLSGGFSKNIDLELIMIHGVIGYRYQKKKGLFFRAGFTPLYVIFLKDEERNNKFYPFAGLSLGYSF